MMEDDGMMGSDELDEWSWGGAAMGAVKGGLGLEEEDDMMEDDYMMEDDMMEQGDYGNSDEDRNEGAWWLEEQGDYGNSDEERNEGAWWLEESSKSTKPKGVGIGKGPKFSYDKKPNMGGGFNEKRKEAFGKGTKAMGTGKAKFEYKEEKEWSDLS